MQLLERAAAVTQLAGQPVEQLGMGRLGAIAAEIVGCIDQSAAKVVLPDAAPDRPPGQDVGWIGYPVRQRGTAGTLAVRLGFLAGEGGAWNTGKWTGGNLLARSLHVAAVQDVDRSRSMGQHGVNLFNGG